MASAYPVIVKPSGNKARIVENRIVLLSVEYSNYCCPPQISTIEANKNFADELQKCLVSFLWDEKPAKIKFTTVIGEQYNGGLGLTHVESFVKSQKISWIKRILSNEKHITVQLLKEFLPEMDLKDFLNCDYDPLMLPYNIPNFYRQVLFAWFEYKSISNVQKRHTRNLNMV